MSSFEDRSRSEPTRLHARSGRSRPWSSYCIIASLITSALLTKLMGQRMSIEDVSTSIEALRIEVLRELHKHQDHNSCITVSALLTRCLRAWRYPNAYPLTVRVSIYNAKARTWMEQFGIPRTEAEIADFNQSGSAHVYIGYTPQNLLPQNHWSGHLAVIVPHLFDELHGLVDLTVVQANKPEWGIELPPMILKVTDHFLAGHKHCSTTVRGCQVIYEAFPDDKSYNKIGHWKKIPKLREMAVRIVDRFAG